MHNLEIKYYNAAYLHLTYSKTKKFQLSLFPCKSIFTACSNEPAGVT